MEGDPTRALVLGYAPASARAGLAALLALDDRLGAIVRAARDPAIGQLRLTWWFEALERLDRAPPPAEPLLRALAADVVPAGVTGAAMAAMVDGWERLLEDEPVEAEAFAGERGERLFAMASTLLGGADPRVATAGRGWALADLVRWQRGTAAPALARMEGLFARAWPRALRPLGAMALLARAELDGANPARTVARVAWHRLTGR